LEREGAGIESKEGTEVETEGIRDNRRDEEGKETGIELRGEMDGNEVGETLVPEGTSCGIELRKIDCSF